MEIKNLTIKYKNKLIVDNISFSIPKNKITILLGKNGSGKSSIVKSIKKIVKYKGDISIGDKKINSMSNKQISKIISYMAQNNNFSDELTVKEFLGFSRHPYSNIFSLQNDEDKIIIDHWVKKFNLQNIINSNINKISGGQKQMAQLAASLIQDTPFIILDEPNNNLDVKHNVELLETIKNLKNKTVILVTHNINDALEYGDHIVLLNKKRIVYEGDANGITKKILEDVYEVKVSYRDKLSFNSKK